MKNQKIGLFSGSFDPITRGHTDLIRKALRTVDLLYVAIARNPAKPNTLLTDTERKQCVYSALGYDFGSDELNKIKVIFANPGFMMDICRDLQVTSYFRGLRNTKDFVYEQEMQQFNEDLGPDITTVFIMPSAENVKISSSAIRGMVGLPGWMSKVNPYIHPQTVLALVKKMEPIEKGYTRIAP